MRVTGGGEQSALWNAIKADALGCRVVRIERAEGAPLGAALVAGFGAGLFRSLDEAATRWVRTAPGTVPDRRLRAHYAARLARYAGLLDTMSHWSEG